MKYLAFDIETAKEWPNGADWRSYRPVGISCAATLPSDAETPRLWHGLTDDDCPAKRMSKPEAAELVEYLTAMAADGYAILTWNGLSFDFDILAEESGMTDQCMRLAHGHVDMMFHVFCELGYPVGLDAAAKGMGLPGKPAGMSGILAPSMWAEGKHKEVLEYVAQDVRTTLQLAVGCQGKKRFHWITRKGQRKSLPLHNGWLPVNSALKLPEPDNSWMSTPLSRKKFTAWLGER